MRRTAKKRRLCLGAHLSVAGGVSRAVDSAQELDLESLQIFTKNANRWEQKPIPADEVARFRERRSEWGDDRPVVSHDSYLINLASPERELRAKSRRAFIDELERAESLGLDFLVTHPGAHVGSGVEPAIERFGKEMRQVYEKVPFGRTRVLLEATAGQGTTLGRTFAELAALLAAVGDDERTAVCLDSCHLFAAGYDLSTATGYDAAMEELDAELGADTIACWHLNDSKGALGSHLDRHENIGEGQIGKIGFRKILKDERFFGVPKILETPKENDGDERNLATLYSL